MGAFTVPVRKDGHCPTMDNLDLNTDATSRRPETAFPAISGSNFKPETVVDVHSSTSTQATDSSSESSKLVSTDLLRPVTPKAIGRYAYMVKCTDHHSRLRAASFIEEAPAVSPTSDWVTSQARARQLALPCQDYPKQQFETVWQYIGAVEMDKIIPPASVSVPNTCGQGMTSPQTEEGKPSVTSARRPTTSTRNSC